MASRRKSGIDALMHPLLERLAHGTALPMSATIAEAATLALQRGFVRLSPGSLQLHLTKRGEQWLRANDPRTASGVTRQAITREANQALADVARAADLPLKDALSSIVLAVHADRDRLTRYARAHGAQYPWEAIRLLLRRAK